MMYKKEGVIHEIKISMYDKILVTVDYDGMGTTTTQFYISGLTARSMRGYNDNLTPTWGIENFLYPKE